MNYDVNQIISRLLNNTAAIQQVWLADNQTPSPPLAYQVDFPRIELILDGVVVDTCNAGQPAAMKEHDVLYIPAKCWNSPQWNTPVTTLSILFGKQQLGFSVLCWDGERFHTLGKQNVARRGPRIGSFLLQALNEMMMQTHDQQTVRFIISSILSHCSDLLSSQIQTSSRSQALFEAVREYIDTKYPEPLTRESVAQAFYISPNYLSHLFQKTGSVGFNEYLNYTRLEHAKTLLKRYDLKVKEVAHACGFVDSNYFCRLFRKNTERSPSEYRRQYHSQLTEKTINQ
jgi:AraC-like DNA-binding protein